MNRFDIIDRLENRYAMNPKGDYFLCQNRMFNTSFGPQPLINYNAGHLEIMLKYSKSQVEYEAWYNDQQIALAMAGAYE